MTDDPAKPRRRPWRWLQFRIRTLLVALLVTGLLLGWWTDRRRLAERLEREQILRQAVRLAQPDPVRSYFEQVFFTDGSGKVVNLPQPAHDSTVEPLPRYWNNDLGLPFTRPNGLPHIGDAARPAEAAVPELIELLADADILTRARAACTLGRFGKDAASATGPLTRALGDADPTVRHNAAYALGQIGPAAREALPALLRAAEGDEMPAFAAQMARRIDPQVDVADRLVELVADRHVETRRRAAAELAAIGRSALGPEKADEAIARIRAMATSADAEDRLAAAEALARLLPRDEALTELARMFRDENDEATRKQLARVLSDLDAAR